MVKKNGENPPKNIDQTESRKKLRDGLKCATFFQFSIKSNNACCVLKFFG